MKRQYRKRVEKNLHLPHQTKAEILRDLDEAFASALEHGETEQQLIDRLGSPEEFAESIHEQLGVSRAEKRLRNGWVGVGAAALMCILAFAAALVIRQSRPAANVIGQADATTTIQVAGKGVDFFLLLMLAGGIAFAVAIGLTLRRIHKMREEKR